MVEAAKSKRIQTRYAVVETLECSQCDQNLKVAELTSHLASNHPETPTTTGAGRLARFKSLTCRLMNPGKQQDAANKRQITPNEAIKLQSPRIKRSTGGPTAKK